MTFKLLNRVRMALTAGGAGDLTLGSAATGFQTMVAAGMNDGDTTPYVLEDGSPIGAIWEIGVGTFHATAGTFSRTTVLQTSAGNTSPITASANAILSATFRAQDLPAVSTPAIVQYATAQAAANNAAIATLPSQPTPGNILLAIGRAQGFDANEFDLVVPGTGLSGITYAFRGIGAGDGRSFTIGSNASATSWGVLVELTNFDPTRLNLPLCVNQKLLTSSMTEVNCLTRTGDLVLAFGGGDAVTATINSGPTMNVNQTQNGSTLFFGSAAGAGQIGGLIATLSSGNMGCFVMSLGGR